MSTTEVHYQVLARKLEECLQKCLQFLLLRP